MQTEHTLWVEKYRPTNLDTYIGNDQLKSKVKVYLESGDLPHLLLFGKAGTGKTTLAKLLVNNIDCDYLYINASDENNVETVRSKVKNFASTMGFKDYKFIILDECDYITPNAQAALRNLMETFSKHCRFILTCNFVERIIDPIQSRCQTFQVIPPNKNDVAKHLHNILTDEGVSYEREDLAILVNSGYPDIRRVINGAQRQSVDGKLVIDKQSIVENDYKLKLLEILEKQDKKSAFNNVRQLMANAKVTDFADLFRLLYDEVDGYGKGHIAECILVIAKYELYGSRQSYFTQKMQAAMEWYFQHDYELILISFE